MAGLGKRQGGLLLDGRTHVTDLERAYLDAEEEGRARGKGIQFEVLFQGTPAQFAAVGKEFSAQWSTRYTPEVLVVRDNVLPDTPLVSATLVAGCGAFEVRTSIVAHALPGGQSRLLAAIEDKYWRIPDFRRDIKSTWDRLYAEMGRQGWVKDAEPVALQLAERMDSEAEMRGWEKVPEGQNRDMVRLWCSGLSAKEIGRKLGYADKTVHNRLSDLRTTYGDEVVPRRRRNEAGIF